MEQEYQLTVDSGVGRPHQKTLFNLNVLETLALPETTGGLTSCARRSVGALLVWGGDSSKSSTVNPFQGAEVELNPVAERSIRSFGEGPMSVKAFAPTVAGAFP